MSRFLLNDASMHDQFGSKADFFAALQRIHQLRAALERAGFALEVNRLLARRPAVRGETVKVVICNDPNRDRASRVLRWFDRDGPFWDAPPLHSPGEYFECLGELVTETALAETFLLLSDGEFASTVSFQPSTFAGEVLEVFWRERAAGNLTFSVRNITEEGALEALLAVVQRPPASWRQLLDWAGANCPALLLSPDILGQLPTTFYPAAARRAQTLLGALQEISDSLQKSDTPRFEELRRLWMEGEKARMTDSSATEKSDFARALSFHHPVSGQTTECAWHAKIKSPQFRIHFEWPKANPGDPLFVAYFGPKITQG